MPEREPARAKINLHLHVTGRRGDGYHTLDSLVVFAAAADIVSAEPDDRFSLVIEGPFAAELRDLNPDDNLVLRAARALARLLDARGAAIRLEKNLPVASGIGGGSTDAAATLRLLHRMWRSPDPIPHELALALGADVPVCLANRSVLMSGAGETLRPAPRLPPLDLVLVNPLIPAATASVFRARRGDFSAAASLPASWTTAGDAARDLAALRNDLQPPAIEIVPVISDIVALLAEQPGCLLARMSGSGATCFGLFEPGDLATRAADALAGRGWWLWHGPVLNGHR